MITDVSTIPMWRKVARWLLVVPVCVGAFVAAYIGSELVMLDSGWVRAVDRSDLNLPIHGLLALQNVLEIFSICALWLIPTFLAIGFAAGWSWLTRIVSGLFAILIFTGMYVWTTQPGNSREVPHVATIAAGVLLLIGAGLLFCRPRNLRHPLAVEITAFVVLLVPSLEEIASAPRALPSPPKIWTRTLQKGTWNAMNTGSEFAATRHLAFAGDRLVAVYESARAPYQGKQPMAEYAIVSLDTKTGGTINEKRFIGHWGATPSLYSNRNGNLILADDALTELHPDLTNSGLRFEVSRGRVEQMSPDGSTMAWETTPGITFLNASTLTATTKHLDFQVAGAVSRDAVLTTNMSRPVEFPNDHSFVTLIDSHGDHLIFHDRCGGSPNFLTNDLIFIKDCEGIRLINRDGHLVRKSPMQGNDRFAGVSQNGKRFAVAVSESRGDPSVRLFEHFVLFDTERAKPLAMIRIEHMPENQSWSAFSADGELFACGDATALSLYKVPGN